MSQRHNPAAYNPVEHVTRDEAERNKRIMGKTEAAQEGPGEGPDHKAKTPNPGKATE